MKTKLFGLGSRGMLTLDALISLIILATIILLIPRFNPNLDLAIAYKEASDVSLVIIASGALGNPTEERYILEMTNPYLQLKIEDRGIVQNVKWNSPKNQFVIERPVFDKTMRTVKFVFGY